MQDSVEIRQAADFGNAVRILFGTPRRKYSIASAYLWLWPAIRLSQIAAIKDSRGSWRGYATWAYLSPETSKYIRSNDPPYLHISDWNEGDEIWIIDFVAPFGNARQLARALRSRLSVYSHTAKRLVRDSSGAIIKDRTIKCRAPKA